MPSERRIDTITPRQAAGAAAVFVAIVVGALGLLQVSASGVSAWWALFYAAVAFAVSYFTVFVTLERFIKARLRVLFRLVHDLKFGHPGGTVVDMGSDVIGRVRDTVDEWAREKGAEIAELKEREKVRREFIGNLSHELKTPIFKIQGYLHTLLDEEDTDAQVRRDFLQRAARGADRLGKIVEDMDMIASLESGRLELELAPTDLKKLVEAELADAGRSAPARGMELRNAIEEVPLVMADPDRLGQVFSNLLENAIRYGRPQGRVEVRAFELEGGQVLVELSDNGMGIAPEHLPRLFERFYRVDRGRSRHEGGSGLGLAIVKHIIEAHGQSISVKSTEGGGTTISFTLAQAR